MYFLDELQGLVYKKNLDKIKSRPRCGRFYVQGVPINMGIQWRIRYRLCCELAL